MSYVILYSAQSRQGIGKIFYPGNYTISQIDANLKTPDGKMDINSFHLTNR